MSEKKLEERIRDGGNCGAEGFGLDQRDWIQIAITWKAVNERKREMVVFSGETKYVGNEEHSSRDYGISMRKGRTKERKKKQQKNKKKQQLLSL